MGAELLSNVIAVTLTRLWAMRPFRQLC